MDFPSSVKRTGLFTILETDNELLNAIDLLRTNAGALAKTIERSVPTFTDHTLQHMDRLWEVADQLLTDVETRRFTSAEAFILTAGFYLHDIGMAFAATHEGLDRIRKSQPYRAFVASTPEHLRSSKETEAGAIAFAVRSIHANAAIELSTAPVPGTEIYLLEPRSIREAWGQICGTVAASHHWNIDRVEREFGTPQIAPFPNHRNGDLVYVASILRLVDYAHINRDRASTLDRAFRGQILPESIIHWLAQEHADGPNREGDYLVYRGANQQKDIDAWWLYYDMLKGLDAEIRSVRRSLDGRISSKGRLCLEGVRGAESPDEAAKYIPTAGFMPLEVNVRAAEIDRLVGILAGESLYGKDPLAAVRELIQNAYDAVTLNAAIAITDLDKAALGIPIRIALTTTGSPMLEVVDWGIGMTKRVMTEYLITIASDYWGTQFHHDFPSLNEFNPTGRFGIGFLSVFMLGDRVTVESNRSGGPRHQMTLRGIARRGEMREMPHQTGSGTAVRIELKPTAVKSLVSLAEKLKIRAPLLQHPLQVEEDGVKTTIPVGWINDLSPQDFVSWTFNAIGEFEKKEGVRVNTYMHMRMTELAYRRLHGRGTGEEWLKNWPEYREDRIRLIASFGNTSLLCLKGFAIQPINTPGFIGVINLNSFTPDASRQRALDVDVSEILKRACAHVRPTVIENLDALASSAFVIKKLGFLSSCARAYGRETLVKSTAPWISVMRIPGDVKQLSATDFSASLRESTSLFLVSGTGPWSAMKLWADNPSKDHREVGVVFDDDHDSTSPGYLSGDEEHIGALPEIWSSWQQAELFATLLGLVAQAWQVNVDALATQDGWHHKSSTLWVRLTRK